MSFVPILWAVHITDGILGWPWLAGGFVLIGVLAVLAAWRVREEEVPRIALMTAAFFVASSIHVKIGPTSAHLLLNGLVGVILGRRAPLAILVGVTMQALLIAHGGVSTIGVNACVQALPALLAGLLFPPLYAIAEGRQQWTRSLLAASSAILLGGCLAFAASLLVSNPLRGMIQYSPQAGLMIRLDHLTPARDFLLHPGTLAGLAVLGLLGVVLERRVTTAPEFSLGVFLGVISVLATTLLIGLVLLADGADQWSTFVSAVLLVHVPIALVEGLILGCTLSFLARVKPEMLGSLTPQPPLPERERGSKSSCSPLPTVGEGLGVRETSRTTVLGLLVMTALLLSARPALAHRLLAEHRVDAANRRVTVESWYETDDVPQSAQARVVRQDGSLLAEGSLDARGQFVFAFETAEPLVVQITAPGGHRATCKITAAELRSAIVHCAVWVWASPRSTFAESSLVLWVARPKIAAEVRASDAGAASSAEAHSHEPRQDGGGQEQSRSEGRLHDLAVGVALVLAAAAFVMSWRNHRMLRRLNSTRLNEPISPPETPLPAPLPTGRCRD
jgi:cobalt/nickel transport system permease protein